MLKMNYNPSPGVSDHHPKALLMIDTQTTPKEQRAG